MGSFLDYVNNQKKTKSTKQGNFGRYVTEKKIGLDTLETDLASASDLVNRVYSGWHSADDMKSSRQTVSAMRDRLTAYRGYANGNSNGQDLTEFNTGMDKLIGAYDTALGAWDALSAEYARYADADSYGVAKKNAERYNKYKGLDFSGVRKAMDENPDDAEFLSKYGLNVGYANKEDVEKELNTVDYLIETTTGEEKKAWKDYRNRLYEATMVNPNALFKGSEAFADGYQPGDVLDALGATTLDAALRGIKGIASSLEGVADLGTYGVSKLAGLVGLDNVEESLKGIAQKNMTQDLYRPLYSTSIYEDSFLGGLGQSVAEGVGQMGFNLMTGQMGAGFGKAGAGIASKAGMFASAAGNSMSEAYNSGATDSEALAYGLLSGSVETGSEMMFGGLGKSVNALGLSRGIAGLDDMFARKVGSKINNFVLRNAAEMGIKATGEGVEELVAGLCSAVAKKFTYMSDEDLEKLIEDEDLLNQFLVGTLSSAVTQTPSLVQSYKYGTDYVTNRTAAEEFVISSDYEARLAEAEKDGKKLSNREKDKLYRQVEEDLTAEQKKVYESAKRNAPNAVGRVASMDVSDTVDNATGESIKVQGIRTDDSGNTVLKTSAGEKAIDSVTLNRRDAELVAMAEGMEPSQADLFVSMYSGQDTTTYKDSFDMAYAYGKNAYGVETAIKRRGVLTEAQALKVYKLGISERTSSQQKQIDVITEKHFAEGGKMVEGKFDDTGVDYTKLNSRQKAAASFAKMFSKATGVNVVLFESKADENGVRKAENGRYESGTNTIYMDVYAGFMESAGVVEDAMIPTLSHELTHWMKEKAPEAYANLSGIVMDTLSQHHKAAPEVLVAAEKKRHKDNGRDVSDEYAQDELIARACEDMLSGNKTAAEIIEKMDAETAKTFSEKFKEVVAKIRAWLKDLLKVYKSNSDEAKILRQYDSKLAELQKAWDEAFAKAVRSNQAINEQTEKVGVSVDAKTNSAYPSSQLSERTWTRSEYVQNRKVAVNALVKALGVTEAEASKYVDDINSIARMIADDRVRLDYEPNLDDNASVFKPNSDYKWTIDMSTLCAKRLLFTGTFDKIQKRLKNTAFASEDIVRLREMMMEKGYEVACGICYVESTRRELGPITQEFIERYKLSQKTGKPITRVNSSGKAVDLVKTDEQMKTTKDKANKKFYADKNYTPTLADLNTTDIDTVKVNHPLVYEAYLNFMNARGQAKPKLLETRAEYKGEIAKKYARTKAGKRNNSVGIMNDAGGLRLQSFSDFEIAHLIDMMQIVLDMSSVGLMSQAYTKVPEFAEVFGETGIKINLSLIAKDSGLDENGNLIFDDVEGIDHKKAFKLRDRFSKNVGTILVGKNDAHIIAAMADDRIDYIIPFHKSSWKESLYDALGLTGYENYTDTQHEKPIDKDREIKDFQPSEYWDYSKTGDENAQIYLEKCREDGRIPKFPQFSSYPGYWKLLIDFKMYDNDGVGAPQMEVQPKFNTWAARRILQKYEGGHRSFPVAEDVVEEFVAEYKKGHPQTQYSDRVEPIAEEDYKNIVKHFGTTGNFNVSGYMLQDGKILDFSGKHWGDTTSRTRQVDHRDISEVLPTERNGFDSMVRMISNGNIRLMPENGGINLAVAPTKNQRTVLRRYIEYFKGEIVVDFDEVGGDTVESFRYDRGTSADRVMRDIDNYFKGGRQSDLMKFHTQYSDRDVAKLDSEYLNAVKNGDMDTAQKMVDDAAKKAGYTEKVYHGSRHIFNEFAKDKRGTNTHTKTSERWFFAADIDTANSYYPYGVMKELARQNPTMWKESDAENMKNKGKLYSLYLKMENPLVADVAGYDYDSHRANADAMMEFVEQAEMDGNDGIILYNVRDNQFKPSAEESTVYMFKESAQAKLADAVTYDDNGNVIPLSQRFNAANDDIRYSDRDSEGNGLTAEQIEFFAESKARDDEGNLLVLYHGTQEATFHSFNTDTIFLTTSPRVAKAYTSDDGYVPKFVDEGKGNIYRLYADIKNPLIVDAANHITGKYDVEVLYYMNTDKYSLTFTNGTETFARTGYGREFIHSMFAEKDADTIVSKAESMEPKGLYSPVKFNRKGKNIDITDPNVYTDIVYNGKTMTADEIAEIAKKEGYDGVIINNVIDDLSFSKNGISATDVIVFSSNQLKRIDNENPTSDPDIRYSERVTDKSLLDYLNEQIDNGEYITVYRSFQVIDGGLYAPMNAVDRDDDGKNKRLGYRSELGQWEMATESPEIAQRYMDEHPDAKYAKFDLDGVDNKTSGVAYNPYLHASNLVLNDQFSAAYRRNLVTVECRVPLSEVGAYKAKYAKDATGWADWKAGSVAGKLVKVKPELSRKLFLSRYMIPVRIVPDSEVAQMYKEYLDGTDISVPWNVVTPSLRMELVKAGVPIAYNDVKKGAGGVTRFADVFTEQYSERQTESIYDAVGELKRVQRENDKLKADIERLRKKNRLERTVTGGRELNESHIAAVAGRVLKLADSRYSREDLADELKVIYEYLQGEDVAWDVFMSKATDLAQRVVAEARERKVTDDYAKMILSTIRSARISLNDTQKAEAEYAYGKNWNRSFFGRVTIANDGIPLESVWSEWASMYPDVFDEDISDADMVTALLDIYDSTRTASEVVETYDKSEAARALAFEMYNQFWNVSPVRTLADKHDKEVKRLKFEHRQEMKELREKTDKKVFETQWHYSKLIHEVREARDEKIAQLKKESHEYTKQYREKIERRNQISQITKKSLKLNTWLKKNSKDEHIVDELKAPVAAVLRALDFSSERFLGTGVPTQKDISLKSAFEHLYKSIYDIDKRQGEDDYSIDMPVDYVEFLESMKDQVNGIVERVGDNEHVLRDMTLEQLQDVNKMLSVLTHIVTSANKALADANGKAISTMAQSTMLYANDLGPKSKKVGAASDFFNFDNGLPVYVFKMMGEGGQRIFRNMQDGWDKMAFHVKQIVDYSKDCYTAKEVKEWSKEIHEFTFADGSTVQMTTAQIMSLYCLQKREQARLHLLKGGMRVADFKVGTDTITNEDGVLLLPHEIDKVVSALTGRQKKVADGLQLFMNTVCSDWGNEVSMRRFGIKSFGEENYFPIQSDASVVTGGDTPKTDRGSEVFRLLNMDFTKALNAHANNRIVVDNIFDVFATHTSDMAKYNALALPVLDMFRWYNYKESYRINPEDPEDTRMRAKSLKQSLRKAYGDGSTKYIMKFMKDINGAHSGGMSNIEKLGRKMISNYKVAAVGANIRVAILQPTSYVRASAVIDPKYLTAALAHKPQIQKAKDTCGIALWKSLGFYDTNISRGVASLIKHDERWYHKAREISMKLAEWGDAMTWGYLYNACEAEIKATQPGLTGEEKDRAVADRLREVIYATQVVDSTMTRTQNMRNPSTMNQIMTSFMSEPSLSYNLLHDLYIQYNADKRQIGKNAAFRKNGKHIARVTASYLVTLCCASLAGGFIDTIRDDEDEEEFFEKLLSNAAENAVSDALSMLPVIKDAVSIYKGFNVGRMDMQGIQSSYYAFRKLYKAFTEGEWDYKTVYSLITSVTKAVSQNSGLPVSNLLRDVTAIWNSTVGEVYESLKVK